MALIRIINGIYGHRLTGSRHPESKQAGDPPFEVSDAEAKRLVGLKVAAYAPQHPTDQEEQPVDDLDDEIDENDDEGEVATPEGGGDGGEAGANPPEDESGTGAKGGGTDETGSEDGDEVSGKPEYSVGMDMASLRALMKDCGLPCPVGTSKAAVVAALDDFYSENGVDALDLGAEDPVI